MRTENIKLLDLDNTEVLDHTYNFLLNRAINMLIKCYEYKVEPYNNKEVSEIINNTVEVQEQIKKALLAVEVVGIYQRNKIK